MWGNPSCDGAACRTAFSRNNSLSSGFLSDFINLSHWCLVILSQTFLTLNFLCINFSTALLKHFNHDDIWTLHPFHSFLFFQLFCCRCAAVFGIIVL